MPKNDREDSTTAVTKVSRQQRPSDHPIMSYTAVTSHQAMAEAFVMEVLRNAQSIIPDHHLSAEELITIFQLALNTQTDRSITMVSGRHLRARITEQVSRAQRYQEPFSLLVLNLDHVRAEEDYDAIVDTLRERMRQTDLIFLFKHRIVLLLPHTNVKPCKILQGRIEQLLKECLDTLPDIATSHLTFPNTSMKNAMEVLDWAENRLRS